MSGVDSKVSGGLISQGEIPNGSASNVKAGDTAGNNDEYGKRIGLLCRVGSKVNTSAELARLLNKILKMIHKTLRVSASSVLMIDKDRSQLYFKSAVGQAQRELKTIRLSADSGIAGWVAKNAKPVVSNDVANDPRFNKKIDKLTGFVTKSIAAVPIVTEGEIIGVIEALNKIDGFGFNKEDLEALMSIASMSAVAIDNSRTKQEILDAYKSTAVSLATAIDAKDPYTQGHSRRVMEYTMLAASCLPFSSTDLTAIEFASLLHDIGKIGIDIRILRKSEKLTPIDWVQMNRHPSIAANIIGAAPYMQKVRDLVLHHHERYDGTGYPDRLKGDEIPKGARLIAVADAFDTMTTRRSYRARISADSALNELNKHAGTQFCPLAVKAFTSTFLEHRENLAYDV